MRACAALSAALLEGARDGQAVAELRHFDTTFLSREQVMGGVPEMIPEIQVEATFPNGIKLVTKSTNRVKRGSMSTADHLEPL